MIQLTVAIPTYNGENRLPEVLEQLRCQRATESIRWEVLVVDNNSSDGTAAVVQQFQKDWPKKSPCDMC
ncbi:glycosyltransferase [Arthrospira platensis BEA 1257B]